MSNPIEQAVAQSAVTSTLKDTDGKSESVYPNFHSQVVKYVFEPTKFGAALSRKLAAVIEEGALENPEFRALLHEFSTTALILTVVAGAAVSTKGLNPGKDVQVLTTLEQLVSVASGFIPLIEKLYEAYEGKVTPTIEVAKQEELLLPASEGDDNGLFEPGSVEKSEAGKHQTSGLAASTATGNAPSKWQPAASGLK